jgi:uncharacterized protein
MQRSTRAILLFLLLSLGFSFCYWATVSIWPKAKLPQVVELFLWGLFRGFGPAVAAFIAAYYKDRNTGVQNILRSLVRWKIQPRWFVLGFAWPVLAVGAGIIAAHFFANMPLKPAAAFTPHMILVFFAMALVDGPLGEEIGWRGFLLPELLAKMNPAVAGMLVGCIWWMWHIPLYLADGKATLWIPYLLQTIALSLIFTWFFLRTSQSILFAIFLHNMANYPIYLSRNLFPQLHNAQVGLYVYFAVVLFLGIAAAVSLMRERSVRFAETA